MNGLIPTADVGPYRAWWMSLPGSSSRQSSMVLPRHAALTDSASVAMSGNAIAACQPVVNTSLANRNW